MMKQLSFTSGTDPEFFLTNTKGELESAIPHIHGTKDKPELLENGAGLQYDNVAVEFASPIAHDAKEMIDSLRVTFQLIKKRLPKGYQLKAIPSVEFPEKELNCREARMFGCSPDFSAWAEAVNSPPEPKTETFRTCGAHFHVGYKEGSKYTFLNDIQGKLATVKAMDIMLGLPSVLLDNSKEAVERRTLYGKAGCFRPKEYGVEYRVLSNFWIKSPALVELMHLLTEDALILVSSGKLDEVINKIGGDVIQQSINEGDVDQTTRVVEQLVKPLMSEESRSLFESVFAKQFIFEEEWN